MRDCGGRRRQLLWAVLLALGPALLAPTGAVGAKLHPALVAKVSYGLVPPGFARTADGTLHVAYETNTSWGDSANGVGAVSISPSGQLGTHLQALDWGNPGGSPNGIPGLAVLASGTLEATFGGSPGGDDGPWGISSSDGGATWSAPVDIGSGSMEFADSAVGVKVSNGTPLLAAGCCGGIVIQQGFGLGSSTYQLTNGTDNAAGNTDLALDAATGAVIAGWDSNAGTGGLWLQQVAPSKGTAVKMPVPTQYGTGVSLIVAGRDSGPGVFAAYPANYANTTHMRLLRYGGGSVAVGSVNGMHAASWGVATGPDGRIWVAWAGQKNGKGITAITRSNKAVTRFEPIQKYSFTWSSLFTLSGDGRLGPLDLLLGGTPATPADAATGLYHARLLPELSVSVKTTKLGSGKFKLNVQVNDAGDAVSVAHVAANGKTATTNSKGVGNVTVSGSPGKRIKVTITHPGYHAVKKKVKL